MGNRDKRRGRDLDPRRWAELGLTVLLRVVMDRSLVPHPSAKYQTRVEKHQPWVGADVREASD